MIPFQKSVAVEFAEKAIPDGELQKALDTLQQNIDNKIGFDGEYSVTSYAGRMSKDIAAEIFTAASGTAGYNKVYKIPDGFMCVTTGGPGSAYVSITLVGIYWAVYSITATPTDYILPSRSNAPLLPYNSGQWDNTPKNNSNKPVTSGGVYSCLAEGKIVESMIGYSVNINANIYTGITLTPIYVGVVKNGNKITFTLFAKIKANSDAINHYTNLYDFVIPTDIGNKIYPYPWSQTANRVDTKTMYLSQDNINGITIPIWINKDSNNKLILGGYIPNNMIADTDYLFRYELTLLLSDNLAV